MVWMIPADLHPRINLLIGFFKFESYGFPIAFAFWFNIFSTLARRLNFFNNKAI